MSKRYRINRTVVRCGTCVFHEPKGKDCHQSIMTGIMACREEWFCENWTNGKPAYKLTATEACMSPQPVLERWWNHLLAEDEED